jgi:hypothetical protein
MPGADYEFARSTSALALWLALSKDRFTLPMRSDFGILMWMAAQAQLTVPRQVK